MLSILLSILFFRIACFLLSNDRQRHNIFLLGVQWTLFRYQYNFLQRLLFCLQSLFHTLELDQCIHNFLMVIFVCLKKCITVCSIIITNVGQQAARSISSHMV